MRRKGIVRREDSLERHCTMFAACLQPEGGGHEKRRAAGADDHRASSTAAKGVLAFFRKHF